MITRRLIPSLLVFVGFLNPTLLSAQSGSFSLQVRSISPMESIRDTVGNVGGLGIGLGYIAVDRMDQSLRGEGILRLDADRFNGNSGSSVKSYTAAFQINLYPMKNYDFYVLFAPVAQTHQFQPAGGPHATYGGFGVQGGIGWALKFRTLHSIEVSYLKMDQVESHNFSTLRYELCFRF